MSRSCYGRKDMFFFDRTDYGIIERLEPEERIKFVDTICNHYFKGDPLPKNFTKSYKEKVGLEK